MKTNNTPTPILAPAPAKPAYHKIDKQDAEWLRSALGKNPAKPQLHLVSVSDHKVYGHCAAVTDGYRLHVLEIDQNIPNGYYTIEKRAGSLIPASLNGQNYPDIWQIIPDKYDDVTDTLPPTILREDAPAVYEIGGSLFSKFYVNQSIPTDCAFQFKTRKPIEQTYTTKLFHQAGLIEIKNPKIKRTQLSVIMPTN